MKKRRNLSGYFLFWRRLLQLGIVLLLVSPAAGFTFFRGNLISATLFGFPLHDPLATIDYFLAGKILLLSFLSGTFLVLVVYWIFGGRSFCSWICPYHLISEMFLPLHRFFRRPKPGFSSSQRYGFLGGFLLMSLILSVPVFESVSPVAAASQLFQSLAESGFSNQSVTDGTGLASILNVWFSGSGILLWFVLFLISIEVFVKPGWWCHGVCPVGTFYSLLGKISPLKITIKHNACDNCGECFKVCPVSQVLIAPVQGTANRVIDSICTQCGNCIDSCPTRALNFGFQFNRQENTDVISSH